VEINAPTITITDTMWNSDDDNSVCSSLSAGRVYISGGVLIEEELDDDGTEGRTKTNKEV